jgi:hypothetical protein
VNATQGTLTFVNDRASRNRLAALLAESERLLAAHPCDISIRGEANLARIFAGVGDNPSMEKCLERMRRLVAE